MKLMNDATAGKIAATPLTYAISSGNAEFVRLYLKYGADAGRIVLLVAAAAGEEERARRELAE